MIGEMIMVGFRGYQVSPDGPLAQDIRNLHIGGVILFDYDVELGKPERNIESPGQVRRLTDQLQEIAGGTLLIAIDMEGGQVARLKEKYGFPSPAKSAEEAGRLDDVEGARADYQRMASTLKAAGINLNLAPVVDVNTNPDNPAIGKLERSYSADPAVVTAYARVFIEAHTGENIATTLKHFPGHGSTWNDSHDGFVDISESWQEMELTPYKDLLASDVPSAIMTAHVVHENLAAQRDDSGKFLPATLSAEVITGLLRDELGFDGVVISDDMQMGAITEVFGRDEAIELAVLAGVDILLFANNLQYEPDVAKRAHAVVRRMVDSGKVSRTRIEQSYARIIAFKERLGLQT